jgi:hypothetical protein
LFVMGFSFSLMKPEERKLTGLEEAAGIVENGPISVRNVRFLTGITDI